MSFTADTPTTEEVLANVLASPIPALPEREQKYGHTLVSWWETDPGYVYIHAEGGSPDDRHYASTLVALQLAPHGYQRHQFNLDDLHLDVGRTSSRRLAGWPDIMAKAKRLLQSGQVQMLRNGFNQVMGHIVGDHGEYDTEISRDDPQSRAITGWQCSCPWDQYAWQRTRKWKKFEGRPCSHVMALYWKALGTPLDEQLSEEQAAGMGTGQKIGPSAQGQPDTHTFDMHPRSFGPEGDIIQGDQLALPGADALGRPGPAQAPLAPPPGGPSPAATPAGPTAPGVLPPFPGEQMQMEWAGPGTTPGGMQSPPGAYSVPGAKPPGPANPVQGPGTYSHVAAQFQAPQTVKLKEPIKGLAQGEPGQNGDGEYRDVPVLKPNGQPNLGEVRSVEQVAGQTWVEVIFPLDDTGSGEPHHVQCFVDASEIEPAAETNAFIRRH